MHTKFWVIKPETGDLWGHRLSWNDIVRIFNTAFTCGWIPPVDEGPVAGHDKQSNKSLGSIKQMSSWIAERLLLLAVCYLTDTSSERYCLPKLSVINFAFSIVAYRATKVNSWRRKLYFSSPHLRFCCSVIRLCVNTSSNSFIVM
jgi:hypothetical protein